MPSITSSSLFAWIVGAFSIVCIIIVLLITKGRGLRNSWQLVKTDLLVRNLCIAWIVIVLFQVINVLFSNPWRGTIVLAGAFLNIVMIVLVSYILPGRLAKKRI